MATRIGLCALTGLIANAFFVITILGKGDLATIVAGAAGGALLGWALPWSRWIPTWHWAAVLPDAVLLAEQRGAPTTVLATTEIQLVTGEAGIDLSNHMQTMPWKRVRLTTPDARYVASFGHAEINRAFYQHLIQACPRAVCISPRGDVQLPPSPSQLPAATWIARLQAIVRREFNGHIKRSLVSGISLAVVTIAVATFLAADAMRGANAAAAPKAFVNVVVFGFGAAWLLGRAALGYRRGARVSHWMDGLFYEATHGPPAPFEGVSIVWPEPAEESLSWPRALVVTLCCALAPVPFLGLASTIAAVVLLRRAPRWQRWLVLIFLAVAITTTTIAALIMVLG
ncbi:MAG: hypothetical protein HYX69_10170 [Planctomycetia bacterium]|nr:hypothetical protein [Planctomycetia bacterium]